MKKIKVYTDGASRGNPGDASIGIVITDEVGIEVQTFKKYLGKFTNNAAEYSALIESVKLLKTINYDFDEINFYCDSELIVKQINGAYKIKSKDLIKLSLEFWKEIKSLNKTFSITHIFREQNKHADILANEAIDEFKDSEIDKSLLIKN